MKEEIKIPTKARIIGGSGDGDKRVYISKDTYQKIFAFSKDKNVCQAGGVLLGNIVNEIGIKYIIIKKFIEAKFSEGTSNSITFTKETWNYIDEEKEKTPEYQIVGWMHTNPDTGCAATDYDVFFHQHMPDAENMVDYVVDPVQIDEAFYFLDGDRLVKSDGFYMFIESSKNKKKKNEHQDVEKSEEHIKEEHKEETIENIGQVEAYEFHQTDNKMDLPEEKAVHQSSLGLKILVPILTVIVIALSIALSVMFVRVYQLEKDVNKLYQNDEALANYINEK